jgi:hypothetical protein
MLQNLIPHHSSADEWHCQALDLNDHVPRICDIGLGDRIIPEMDGRNSAAATGDMELQKVEGLSVANLALNNFHCRLI